MASRCLWRSLAGWECQFGALGLSALLAACGSKSATSSVSIDPGAEPTRPVTVTGIPLPTYTGKGTDPALGMTPPTLAGENFTGTPVVIAPGTGGPMLVVTSWMIVATHIADVGLWGVFLAWRGALPITYRIGPGPEAGVALVIELRSHAVAEALSVGQLFRIDEAGVG
jgi:hypothetical protein